MSLPQIFNFDNHAVRTIEKDGDIWFVAADVTDVLGYKNGRDAIAKHCKGVAFYDTPTTSGIQAMSILPERDLYRLVMKSKLPAAEKFENWVVSEVLPTIRKTGTYTPAETPEIQLANAMLLAGRMIDEQKALLAQRDKMIAITAPKAAIVDRIEASEGLYGFRQVAKIISVNENKLRAWLIHNDWIYYLGGKITAKSAILRKGLADTRVKTIKIDGHDDKTIVDMYFTPKGLTHLTGIFCQLDLQEAA